MHTEVVGLYMLHPLLPGMQATHGIQQGGCSVTEAAKLQANCQTGCRLPLPSHFFLFSLLKMFFFQTESSLSQKPFANSLVTVKLVVMFFNNSGFGANALSDSFRYSIHTAVYILVPILSVVAIQAI